MTKRFVKRAFVIIAVTLLLLISALFIARTALLDYAINKIEAKAAAKYPITLYIENAEFSGINTVLLQRVTIVPNTADTIVTVDSVAASISITRLFLGQVRIRQLSTQRISITLVKHDSTDNYSFLLKKRKTNTDSLQLRVNLADFFREQIENTFAKTPKELDLHNISISFTQHDKQVKCSTALLSLADKEVKAAIVYESPTGMQNWKLQGLLDKSANNASIKLFADTGLLSVPFINEQWNAYAAFDTASFSLSGEDYSGGILHLQGQMYISGLVMNHPKLATTDVNIPYASLNYAISIGEQDIQLDSTSTAIFGDVATHPFIHYQRRPTKTLALALDMPAIEGDKFFGSLPQGMFTATAGIKATGKLSYNMRFQLDFNNPDSVRFASDMNKQDFHITQYGAEYLPKMNGSFSYTAYEKGLPVRTFTVGPENLSFTPLNNITPYLRNALLTSEDGSFFYHKGFNEDAFRKSIAENIRQGRFARGGSTITMQLVKNVFLSRNKTIARKAEEALIVWLIENNYLCSKERMYEVYLNIIEWGPYVYGIHDAAAFYFNKRPADLTLAESIYLASIVPRPKAFKYSFNEQGRLRESLAGYFNRVSAFMLKKGLISEMEYATLEPNVELKGRAKQMILPKDSIPVDVLFDNEFR